MSGRCGVALLCMLAVCARAAALRTLPGTTGALRAVGVSTTTKMGALHSAMASSGWFPSAASSAPGRGHSVVRMSGGSAAAVDGDGGGEVKTTTAEERADAEALKQGAASSVGEGECDSSTLDDFEAVDISPSGTFKYVLIEAKDPQGNVKHLVRGYRDSEYHVYAARPTVEKLRDAGMAAKVLGGGRLKHAPEQRTLHLWGKSHSFGREDKSISQGVCQAFYPDYKVTWENGGY